MDFRGVWKRCLRLCYKSSLLQRWSLTRSIFSSRASSMTIEEILSKITVQLNAKSTKTSSTVPAKHHHSPNCLHRPLRREQRRFTGWRHESNSPPLLHPDLGLIIEAVGTRWPGWSPWHLSVISSRRNEEEEEGVFREVGARKGGNSPSPLHPLRQIID